MAVAKKAKLKKIADQYVRHPAGSPGGKGGEFAPKSKTNSVVGDGVPAYVSKKKLGAGVFGKVELTDRGTAVKAISLNKIKKFLKKKASEVIQREVSAYQELGDLGITPKLLSHDTMPGEGQSTGEFRMEIEFLANHKTMGGAKFPRPSNDRQQANMESQVLKMHQAGWVHGDLHGDNVMVGPDDAVKIIDMGLARKLRFDAPDITPPKIDEFIVYLLEDFERIGASEDGKTASRYQSLNDDMLSVRNQYMNDRGQYPPEIQQDAMAGMKKAYDRFRR